MQVTDPIADLLTRVRNGQKAGHDIVKVPASKLKIAVTKLLKDEGFVLAYKCIRDDRQGMIKIALKYDDVTRKGVIRELKRVSKPGRRVYVDSKSLPKVKNNFGVAVLSTSRGIMTCKEAGKRNIGGEYLCSVY